MPIIELTGEKYAFVVRATSLLVEAIEARGGSAPWRMIGDLVEPGDYGAQFVRVYKDQMPAVAAILRSDAEIPDYPKADAPKPE